MVNPDYVMIIDNPTKKEDISKIRSLRQIVNNVMLPLHIPSFSLSYRMVCASVREGNPRALQYLSYCTCERCTLFIVRHLM